LAFEFEHHAMFALRIVRSFGCVAPQARSQMSGTTRRPCSFLALGVQRARRAALVRRKGFGEGVQNDLPQEQGVAGGGEHHPVLVRLEASR
jgi:hypothetical protein